MKKLLLISLLMLISLPVFASRDSIAFFYKTEKVGILLNERGTNGRIQNFMDFLGAQENMLLLSKNGDVKLGCARNEENASCTFTFLPSANVETQNKELNVKISLNQFDLEVTEDFEMSFLGSMKDKLDLKVIDNELIIYAAKK